MRYLVLFLFISCGMKMSDKTVLVDGTNNRPGKIHKDFQPYVDKFFDYYGKTEEIIVEYTQDEDYAGVCYYWLIGSNEIKINQKYWNNASDMQREQLIFHELGHCILNRDHDDSHVDIQGFMCPNSIMRSWAFNYFEIQYCYNKDYDHYIGDLL